MIKNYTLAKHEILALFIGFLLSTLLVVLTWVQVQEPVSLIIIGFSPTFLYILLNVLHLEYQDQKHILLFFSPLALVGVFFLLGELFPATMDIAVLAFLNLFLCYALSILFFISTFQRPKNHRVHHRVEEHGELERPIR